MVSSAVRRVWCALCVFTRVCECACACAGDSNPLSQAQPGCKLLKNFNPALEEDAELKALKAEVNHFSKKFAMPGIQHE